MEESSDDDHQTLSQTLHVQTPLIHSPKLSVKLDCNIYFKIENVQPSGSVKMRGIGNFCYKAVESRGRDIHLVCGSGTNTVLAVAYCARQLNVSAITVMPKDTPSSICDSVRLEGAHLILYGEDWAAADEHARKLVKRNGVYVPSSDHADIWQGHASIIHELKTQLQDNPPAAIICPVGGGGLLNGVITGLQSVGWKSVPVIAVETHGSNAFQASVVAGKLVTLPKISTIASGLASSTVSSKSLELSLVHPVVPFAVSDAMAADAVRLFAEDAKMIVEAASGAALSLCYTQLIRDILPSLGQDCEVIVLVTGGSDISLTQLDEYRKKYYRPPVIVKSGGEVFLKMDDKLTHIQSIDSTEPLGISSDNLTKLNQSNKQKTKESNKQQKLQQQQLQLQQKQELLQQQEKQLQQQQLQQQQQQQHQQLQPQQPQQIQKLQLQQAQPQLLPQLQSQIQSQLQPLQQLQQLQQLQSHLQSHLQSQEQNAIVDTPMEETFQSSTQEEDPSSIKPLTPANTQ